MIRKIIQVESSNFTAFVGDDTRAAAEKPRMNNISELGNVKPG